MNEAMPIDEAGQVLARRAAQLARAPAAAEAEALLQVLEFDIAGQPCALELRWLCELRPLRGVAPLPHTAPGVLGVAHVRGRMLPLVDPAPLLGLPSGGWPQQGRLLVMGATAPIFSFVAAEVHGLRQVSPAQVERRSAPLAAVRPEHVLGITASGRVLLDGAGLIHYFKDFPACSLT